MDPATTMYIATGVAMILAALLWNRFYTPPSPEQERRRAAEHEEWRARREARRQRRYVKRVQRQYQREAWQRKRAQAPQQTTFFAFFDVHDD